MHESVIVTKHFSSGSEKVKPIEKTHNRNFHKCTHCTEEICFQLGRFLNLANALLIKLPENVMHGNY